MDTGVFIEHRDEFPESLASVEQRVDPKRLDSKLADGTPIQFVVPIQVIDELDYTKADRSRGRARVALARLNEILTEPSKPAIVPGLREGSRLHLLLDELGHVRLPVADDEIVDRACYLESVAGRGSVGVSFSVARAALATGSRTVTVT